MDKKQSEEAKKKLMKFFTINALLTTIILILSFYVINYNITLIDYELQFREYQNNLFDKPIEIHPINYKYITALLLILILNQMYYLTLLYYLTKPLNTSKT